MYCPPYCWCLHKTHKYGGGGGGSGDGGEEASTAHAHALHHVDQGYTSDRQNEDHPQTPVTERNGKKESIFLKKNSLLQKIRNNDKLRLLPPSRGCVVIYGLKTTTEKKAMQCSMTHNDLQNTFNLVHNADFPYNVNPFVPSPGLQKEAASIIVITNARLNIQKCKQHVQTKAGRKD